jgi:hypothetical protein
MVSLKYPAMPQNTFSHIYLFFWIRIFFILSTDEAKGPSSEGYQNNQKPISFIHASPPTEFWYDQGRYWSPCGSANSHYSRREDFSRNFCWTSIWKYCKVQAIFFTVGTYCYDRLLNCAGFIKWKSFSLFPLQFSTLPRTRFKPSNSIDILLPASRIYPMEEGDVAPIYPLGIMGRRLPNHLRIKETFCLFINHLQFLMTIKQPPVYNTDMRCLWRGLVR